LQSFNSIIINMSSEKTTKSNKTNPLQHLIAGGCAGLVESSICHPLDTIKTRMQLRKNQVESVERKIQHSLVEPALRLKHSLQEPAALLRMNLKQHSLQDAQQTINTITTVKATPSGGTLMHEVSSSSSSASLRGLPPQMTPGAAKVSVQLNTPMRGGTTVASLGPYGTAKRIVQREGFFALYKGLTAVYTGIIPKMAIRFVSFEQYKDWLNDYTSLGRSTTATFTAGLMSGLTEAVLVVTPAEVCKVRVTAFQ
jgi:Mitochondrial carrier protein